MHTPWLQEHTIILFHTQLSPMSRLENSPGLPEDLSHSTAVTAWTTDVGKWLHCCIGVNKIPCHLTRPSDRAGSKPSHCHGVWSYLWIWINITKLLAQIYMKRVQDHMLIYFQSLWTVSQKMLWFFLDFFPCADPNGVSLWPILKHKTNSNEYFKQAETCCDSD